MSAICAVVYVIWTDVHGAHHPRVLTGKCRVAPLVGTTIPRGELQALVIVHRLLRTVVEAFPFRPQSVSAYTDSLCSMGAVYKSSPSMRPFFGNRVAEILRIREQLAEVTDHLDPISHITGDENPADVGTRGAVGIGDLGPGSRWQTGPRFLSEDFSEWPRTEISQVPAMDLPAEVGPLPSFTHHVRTQRGGVPREQTADSPPPVRNDVKTSTAGWQPCGTHPAGHVRGIPAEGGYIRLNVKWRWKGRNWNSR